MEKLFRTIALLIMVVGVPTALSAQAGGTISGQVVDDVTSQPLANVQVFVAGTSLGTLTNVQGRYSLANVPAGTAELRASRLGYASLTQTVTVSAGAAAAVDFRLTTSAVALDEVVVTGTAGAVERRANSAVVASVNASSIVETAPVSSLQDLLTARVPGMSVTASSGSTGTAQQIRIRGASSISLSNEPLLIIDGVMADSRTQSNLTGGGLSLGGQGQSRLSDINPADIESIEIVKGPAAATLYGADASAGVIQIITKRGRLGSNQFVQSLSFEYNDIDPNFTPLTAYYRCTAAAVTIQNGLCGGLSAGDVVSDNPLGRTDVFRNGSLQSLNYSARGGGDSYGYYVSLSADDEDGTLPNNAMERRSVRTNFNFTPNAKLSIDAGFGLTNNKLDLPMNDNNVYGYLGVAYLGSPAAVRIVNGQRTLGTYAGRPFEAIKAIESVSTNLRVNPTIQVNYLATSWLANRLTIGGDFTRGNSVQYFPINSLNWYQGDTNTGDLEEIRVNNDVLTLDYLGTISNDLSESIASKLSFGAQLVSEKYDRVSGFGVGFVTTGNRVVGDAAQISASQGYSDTKRVGVLGQWDLSFNDRLYLQFGARVDQNSSFGENAEAFFLPKVGASYVISEEAFWDGLASTIPSLRLRAAWGQTGRSPTSGASLETYEARPFAILEGTGSSAGVVPLNPGNLDLKPERGTEFEAGFDAGFFQNRLGLELTYFSKVATDVLLRRPVPPSTGASSNPFVNIGETRNSGIEYALRGTILNTPTVQWEARIAGSTLKNELVDLGDVEPFGTVARMEAGHSMGFLSTRLVREVIEVAGDPRCRLVDGVRAPCVIVSDADEFFGNSLPTYEGNFGTSITLLNNFQLSGQVDWKGGNHIYNNTMQFRERSFGTSELAVRRDEILTTEERMRRWGPFAAESLKDEFGEPLAIPLTNVHDQYFESADFVRIREIAATYFLPAELANRFRASSASITLGARNLALFTDYTGADPEVLSAGTASQTSFVREDFFTVPQTRRLVLKMNLSF